MCDLCVFCCCCRVRIVRVRIVQVNGKSRRHLQGAGLGQRCDLFALRRVGFGCKRLAEMEVVGASLHRRGQHRIAKDRDAVVHHEELHEPAAARGKVAYRLYACGTGKARDVFKRACSTTGPTTRASSAPQVG